MSGGGETTGLVGVVSGIDSSGREVDIPAVERPGPFCSFGGCAADECERALAIGRRQLASYSAPVADPTRKELDLRIAKAGQRVQLVGQYTLSGFIENFAFDIDELPKNVSIEDYKQPCITITASPDREHALLEIPEAQKVILFGPPRSAGQGPSVIAFPAEHGFFIDDKVVLVMPGSKAEMVAFDPRSGTKRAVPLFDGLDCSGFVTSDPVGDRGPIGFCRSRDDGQDRRIAWLGGGSWAREFSDRDPGPRRT